MAEPIYKRYGMTREEWAQMDDTACSKLTDQVWVTLPCEECQKPVIVLATTEPGENKTWCLEHAGTWKDGGEQ